MSIISHCAAPSTVPAGYESHHCYVCDAAILVRSDTPESPICRACQRMQVDKATHEALTIIRALRKAEPPFDVLSEAERAEQLASLIDTGNPAARSAVAHLTDQALIDTITDAHEPELVGAAAAELADRVDAIPDPDERRRIESDDEQYHRELTMAREAEAAEQPIDHNDW